MPSVFEAWDLAVQPITVRSRLYSLAPIGIGTAFVEGLSGYVMRLADAHAVSTGSLIGKELSSTQLGCADLANLGRFWATINGVGDSAKRWVEGLEDLTLRSDLRSLTLLPFERLFAKTLLFRRVRAWCSACYEQMASTGEAVYEPLLWCMKLVEVCPRHHGPLATTCPHCFRSQRPLTAASRPGFCSWCGLWLGHTTDPAPARSLAAVPAKYQLWVAEAIGKLFAGAPRVQPECLRDRARNALLTYVRISAEGNRAAVAEVTGMSIYEWSNGGSAPRIDTLLRTWYQLRLPVECLLDDSYASCLNVQEEKDALGIRDIRKRKVAPSRTREQLRARLEAALDEQPAPSVNEIARRLGYSTAARLYEADRHLCGRITARYRKSGRGNWWRSGGAKSICEPSRVKEVLEDYLHSDKPIPPLNHIASSLGYAANTSLRDRFPELCCALSAKIADQKQARAAAIEPALEQALQENPPPSLQEIATRLGFSSISTLKAHAPGLCERLKVQCRAYWERSRVELRSKLEAVLIENPPPSLRSVYSRFNVTESIVSTSFPELRRAIGLRHLQYQKQQSRTRRQDLQTEIREIVQILHAQGICPSVPRVTSLLKSGSLREWTVVNDAVRHARKELIH